jgi:hypothetical protein
MVITIEPDGPSRTDTEDTDETAFERGAHGAGP